MLMPANPMRALAHLPREARDTLFLLAVIGWLVAPHVQHLPLWCVALAGLVLAWRGWLAWHSQPLPGRWWRVALLVLALGATLASHKTLLGRDAGVTLLVVLLALKTLELRARRDAFVVFFLGFFLMLTHFFFSQSLLTAAAMLLGLLGLLTALVNAHKPVGRPSLLASARTAGGMALLGAPVMLVLFMFFPRIAPLWGTPSDAMTGRTGLSPTMQVGAVAQLAQDDSIALRVKFDGAPPPQADIYFRGPVLTHFDGREWKPALDAAPLLGASAARITPASDAVRYELTLEPHQRPWLLLMDAATEAPQLPPGSGPALMSPELLWATPRPVTDLLRYRASSHPRFTYQPTQPGATSRAALAVNRALPAGFNPRTLALAAQMRADPRYAQAQASDWVRAALERLRTGGYVYTLEPGVTGPHAADEFWFDTKMGFCEHIASAFVVLMRALDVPARIVTGYQGGQINDVDGYWTVRQSDAHAWAEVWIDGQGWTRVDPTGAVMPGRIGEFRRLAPAPGVVGTVIGVAISPTLAQQMRKLWEAANNAWNQRVLNYTQTRQLDVLKNLGFNAPSWQDLLQLMAAILVAAVALALAWALWERRQHDPWLRLLAQARRRLAAAGVDVPAQASPRALAALLAPYLPQNPHLLRNRDWLIAFEAYRYAPPVPKTASSGANASGAAKLRQLGQQLRGLSWRVFSDSAALKTNRTLHTPLPGQNEQGKTHSLLGL